MYRGLPIIQTNIHMAPVGVKPRPPHLGGQGGLVVKRPPGNQKVGVSNPTTATWYKKRKMDIGIAPCTESAPMVNQDLSASH